MGCEAELLRRDRRNNYVKTTSYWKQRRRTILKVSVVKRGELNIQHTNRKEPTMAFDFVRDDHVFTWNSKAWQGVFELATSYGWTPMGTTIDDGREAYNDDWAGGYFTNDGQRMLQEDAQNLAEALERALPNLADDNDLAEYVRGKGCLVYPDGVGVPITMRFGGRVLREKIQHFIAFLKGGEVLIC
jgi:hypothetical protein